MKKNMKLSPIVHYILLAVLACSCTFSSIPQKIYSKPDWDNTSEDSKEDISKILIVSTNNFEGNIQSQTESIFLNKINKYLTFEVGGSEILYSYLKILRKRYQGNVLFVDSGNSLKNNGMEDNKLKALKLFDKLNYHAMAFGLDEIKNLYPQDQYLGKYKIPFINSNIINLKTGKLLDNENITSYKIYQVNKTQIGIISISSNLIKKQNKKLKGLYFLDPILSILKTKKRLKKLGVDIIILLAQLNTTCSSPKFRRQKTLNDWKSHKLHCPKEDKDELVKLIKRLPPNTIDFIIGGSDTFSTGFINQIPVIQNPGKGKYIGLLEINFNNITKKVIKDKTKIYQPIKLCHNFLYQTNDCHLGKDLPPDNSASYQRLTKLDNFSIVPAKFLGIKVVKDDRPSKTLGL